MARNRVIYQSEALFVSPNATGAHFTCTAVETGLGPITPFGVSPAAVEGGPLAGQTGNAIGLMNLVNPVGLTTDPYHTHNTPVANFSKVKLDQATKAGVNYSNTSVLDIANLTGEAVSSFSEIMQDRRGYQPTAVQFNGGGTQDAAATTIKAGGSGVLNVFTRKDHWENAKLAYFETDQKTHPAGGVYDPPAQQKDSAGFGIFVSPWSGTYNNLIQQVHRVQSANYSFTVNRTDINTFGQLARIDAIALEPPTVNLDFTYFPTDGFNERNLGFYIQGAGSGVGTGPNVLNAATNHLKSDNAGKNFFILTTPESTDAFNSTDAISDRSVIGLGNGFLSDYTLEASVGSVPTSSATIELYNAKSDIGSTGVNIPGVNLQEGTSITGIHYSLGHPKSMRGDTGGAQPSTGEFGYAALSAVRPGDITLEIPQDLSMFSKVSGDGQIHIQNFSLSMPLSRSPIDRLGTRFAFSRVVDLPVTATLSISALMSEVGTGNLADLIDDCKEHDVKIRLKGNSSCEPGAEKFDAMVLDFKGARIDSESISSDIGSNKSVDLTFTTQIGGPEDLIHGVFISGRNANDIPEHYSIPGR